MWSILLSCLLLVVLADTYGPIPGLQIDNNKAPSAPPIGFIYPAVYNNQPLNTQQQQYVDPYYNYNRPPQVINQINSNNDNIGLNYKCVQPAYDLPGSHSVFYGCRAPQDKLLFVENIYKAKRLFSTREKRIDYPGGAPKGFVHDENITAIWCYDLQGYGHGGFCNIVGGGIGKRHVQMHLFQKDRNTELHFKVEIYGRKMNATNNINGNKWFPKK